MGRCIWRGDERLVRASASEVPVKPRGPGYENIAITSQVCTTVGSQTGEAFVSGPWYLQLAFGYLYSHLRLNFGTVIVFGVAFVLGLLVFTEFNMSMAAETAVVLFKQGSKVMDAKASGGVDAEKGSESSVEVREKEKEEARRALAEQPRMTDIFSWQHLQYTVPIPGSADRRLSDDVSGYVALVS